jgi:hypothetical protein
MPPDRPTRSYEDFTAWLARRSRSACAEHQARPVLLRAARAARDATLSATTGAAASRWEAGGHLECVQLLAAADGCDTSRPTELVTPRGFRVALAYDEGSDPNGSSICVLVRCPPELVEVITGKTVFLWAGCVRFELGEFDSEGKAIGTLPAGLDISLGDFASGHVKLEAPPLRDDR